MSINEYWNKFLSDTNRKPDDAVFSGELTFSGEGIFSSQRLLLTLLGKRTASFSAFDSYAINREPLPVSGEFYILEDSEENPRGIIELESVSVLPFDDVSWEMAKREGEDASLEEWREKTRSVLEDEGAVCGFVVNGGTKVVCEFFRLVYR